MPVVRNPQFYFKEGFCWNNVTLGGIKCRLKQKTVHSTESMSFFSESEIIPEFYMVILMNTKLISDYIDVFVNNTVHCTTGDAKLIPIMVPDKQTLKVFEKLFNSAVEIKKITLLSNEFENQLLEIQERLDTMVNELYRV